MQTPTRSSANQEIQTRKRQIPERMASLSATAMLGATSILLARGSQVPVQAEYQNKQQQQQLRTPINEGHLERVQAGEVDGERHPHQQVQSNQSTNQSSSGYYGNAHSKATQIVNRTTNEAKTIDSNRARINQTSAKTIGSRSGRQTPTSQQAIYHQEFNRMRERLFRLLSKVPIQVEEQPVFSSPKALDRSTPSSSSTNNSSSSCSSSSASSASPLTSLTSSRSVPSSTGSSNSQRAIKRQPLVIKYYNERSLADILELHFSCSLSKHNFASQSSSAQEGTPEPLVDGQLQTVASGQFECQHGCLGEPMIYHDNQARAYASRFQDQQQQAVYTSPNWQAQFNPPTESISLAMSGWQQQQQQHELGSNHTVNHDFQEKQTSVNQANHQRSSPTATTRVDVKEGHQQQLRQVSGPGRRARRQSAIKPAQANCRRQANSQPPTSIVQQDNPDTISSPSSSQMNGTRGEPNSLYTDRAGPDFKRHNACTLTATPTISTTTTIELGQPKQQSFMGQEAPSPHLGQGFTQNSQLDPGIPHQSAPFTTKPQQQQLVDTDHYHSNNHHHHLQQPHHLNQHTELDHYELHARTGGGGNPQTNDCRQPVAVLQQFTNQTLVQHQNHGHQPQPNQLAYAGLFNQQLEMYAELMDQQHSGPAGYHSIMSNQQQPSETNMEHQPQVLLNQQPDYCYQQPQQQHPHPHQPLHHHQQQQHLQQQQISNPIYLDGSLAESWQQVCQPVAISEIDERQQVQHQQMIDRHLTICENYERNGHYLAQGANNYHLTVYAMPTPSSTELT